MPAANPGRAVRPTPLQRPKTGSRDPWPTPRPQVPVGVQGGYDRQIAQVFDKWRGIVLAQAAGGDPDGTRHLTEEATRYARMLHLTDAEESDLRVRLTADRWSITRHTIVKELGGEFRLGDGTGTDGPRTLEHDRRRQLREARISPQDLPRRAEAAPA